MLLLHYETVSSKHVHKTDDASPSCIDTHTHTRYAFHSYTQGLAGSYGPVTMQLGLILCIELEGHFFPSSLLYMPPSLFLFRSLVLCVCRTFYLNIRGGSICYMFIICWGERKTIRLVSLLTINDIFIVEYSRRVERERACRKKGKRRGLSSLSLVSMLLF